MLRQANIQRRDESLSDVVGMTGLVINIIGVLITVIGVFGWRHRRGKQEVLFSS
jgi:predicted negative regulator of RcsB-dependent stress response